MVNLWPSSFNTLFFRFFSWRLLKAGSGRAGTLGISTFVIANTLLAVTPLPILDWLGANLWKLLVHWVGFLLLLASIICTHLKQPAELRSGGYGGTRADKFMSTLDWSRFLDTKEMLEQTMAEAQKGQFPGIEQKETLLANQALTEAEKYKNNATREELKAPYRQMMVARFDLLIYFDPENRKICAFLFILGCGLMLSPHLFHFLTVLLRLALPNA